MGASTTDSPGSALRLEAVDALLHEPRLLQDARFLGALHAELAEHVGPDEAARTLFEIGFYQGLRDATALLQKGFLQRDAAPLPTPPLLAMRLAPPRSRPAGALEIRGTWPEQNEACARVSALGAAREPSCHASAGYTSGWLSGLFELDLLAVESTCSARGEAACAFTARDNEQWRASGDARAARLLDVLDVGALRGLVADEISRAPRPEPAEGSFDPDAPVVHVWGPVMVVPFAGVDASLRAVELIHTDAAASRVCVVVVDLGDVILDEGLGAAAVERLLESIQGAGAEPILTGVSPISMSVVADLEGGRVLVEKDLAQAIATAFQIADVQRRPI